MLGNDLAILADLNAIGIGANLDGTADGTGHDRVFVAVEADQAGFGDRRRRSMEAIEAAGIRHQAWPFCLEDLPDRPGPELWMVVDLA